MTDYFTLALILFGVILVCGLIAWVFFRSTRGYKLYVRDGGNPRNTPKVWFCLFNKDKDVFYVFKSILHPIQSDVRPYFDPTAFDKGKHRIDIISKPSGRADEIAWLPVDIPIVSGAGAEAQAAKISESIIDKLAKGFTYKEKNPDTGEIEIKVYQPNFNTKLLLAMFSKEWVERTIGVIPIQDANLFLLHHKVHIGTAKQIADRHRINNSSWLARNPWAAPTAFMFIIIVVGAVVYYQGIATAVTNAQQGTQASTQLLTSVNKLLNHTSGGTVVPAPTPPHGNQSVNVT